MRKPAPESQPDKGAAEHTCGRQVRGFICSFCPAVAGAGYIRVPTVGSAAGCIKHFTGSVLSEHGCCKVWGLRAQWGSSPISSVCSAAICEGLRAVWGETMKFPCPNKKGRTEKPEFGKSTGIWVAGRDKHPLLCCRLFAAWEFSPPTATGLVGSWAGSLNLWIQVARGKQGVTLVTQAEILLSTRGWPRLGNHIWCSPAESPREARVSCCEGAHYWEPKGWKVN